MSTERIDIVKGDGKFELIAQMVDCAQNKGWKDRQPFRLTLKVAEGDELDRGLNELSSRPKSKIIVPTKAILTGFDSNGGNGESWLIRGIILEETILDNPWLESLRRFKALFNTQVRSGWLESQLV